jgi:hypothetical protein
MSWLRRRCITSPHRVLRDEHIEPECHPPRGSRIYSEGRNFVADSTGILPLTEELALESWPVLSGHTLRWSFRKAYLGTSTCRIIRWLPTYFYDDFQKSPTLQILVIQPT